MSELPISSSLGIDRRSPRVLVIDDERHVRGLICDLLASWGCAAEPVASGAEALARFADGDYDMVVTDFTMAGMTGLEVVEQIRPADPTLPVIMLTGSSVDLDAASCRLGFTLLHKPVDLATLRGEVDRALEATAGRRGMPA
jgi:CheY-like chemotaxis protein